MQRAYELTLIINSQLPEEGVEEAVKRYEDVLVQQDATVINVDRWGVRRLAYEVSKHQQGFYAFIQFQGDPEILLELDRSCRLDEAVLRHMIVVVEGGLKPPDSDVEAEDISAEPEGEGEADEEADESEDAGETQEEEGEA